MNFYFDVMLFLAGMGRGLRGEMGNKTYKIFDPVTHSFPKWAIFYRRGRYSYEE